MFNKKFFLVAAGYIAGGLVSSLYGKKKPSQLKKEIKEGKEKGQSELKVLLSNFVDTHKNLLSDIEEEVMSDKNKAFFLSKKVQLLEMADTYKAEGYRLLDELQIKGKTYLVEASSKLEELYLEKKEELDQLKDLSPEKVQELKGNLFYVFEELKGKMKNKFKNKDPE